MRTVISVFGSVVVATTCVFIFSPSIGAELKTGARPNVILIVSDYMGYSDIGPYGATDVRTPALDTLAAEGIRFSNYYAASPVCVPSRASLLSGVYSQSVLQRSETQGRGLPAEHSTLVRELKAAGYKTGVVGKWHLGADPNFRPTDHGFDTFFGFHSWTLGYHDHRTSEGEPGLFRGNQLVTEEGYLTDLFTDEALRFVDDNQHEPFLLYLAYNVALPPYQPPGLAKSRWGEGWDVNEASRSDYIAMVESMDMGIGKVLDKLKDLQLEENTLVIFTYDHGGRHLVDSGPLFHGFSTLWEGGIRVPLIMRWPAQFKRGVLVEQPAIAMDLTATMLDAAGRGGRLSDLDGMSLIPLVDDSSEIRQRTFFWSFGSMKAVREGKWKYVVDDQTQLLFDLSDDVSERHDVYAAHPDIVKKLRGALNDWEAAVSSD